MQKNKLVIALALGMLILPTVSLKAEESSTGASAGVEVNTSAGIHREVDGKGRPASQIVNPEFDGDHPRLPPPMPLNKEKAGEKADVGSVRAGIKGNMRLEDDKGPRPGMTGPRIENGKSDRPQLSEEEKAAIKVKMDARKAEIKGKIEARKDENKVKLEAKAKDRVKALLANVFKMLSNQIDRLSKVDKRIGEKIAALQTSGIDVTAMNTQYVIAQTALAKAKVDVEATSSISTEQADTETSKEALRSLVKTAEDSIKAAGAEYRKVIALMPKEAPKGEVEAQTSTSTNVQQ
jgi:hypothetical protein